MVLETIGTTVLLANMGSAGFGTESARDIYLNAIKANKKLKERVKKGEGGLGLRLNLLLRQADLALGHGIPSWLSVVDAKGLDFVSTVFTGKPDRKVDANEKPTMELTNWANARSIIAPLMFGAGAVLTGGTGLGAVSTLAALHSGSRLAGRLIGNVVFGIVNQKYAAEEEESSRYTRTATASAAAVAPAAAAA